MEQSRYRLVRSRWAAIGAAVAVTLGGGGLIGVSAAGSASSFTTVDTTRIMDTRAGDRVSNEWVRLQVTGEVPTYTNTGLVDATVIPTGAAAVSANITVTGASTSGFLSAVACTAADMPEGLPSVSAANFAAGYDVANAMTVPLGSDGSICIYVFGSSHVLVDAAGYYSEAAGAVDAYTKSETDDLLDELATVVAWPVMTMQHSTQTLQVRGGAGQCPVVANMVQYTNISTTIDTDVNSGSTRSCFTVLPLATPSAAHGARWVPAEVVVCADIDAGAELTSVSLFAEEPLLSLSLLSPVDLPETADGCFAYDIYEDMQTAYGNDLVWGSSSYQLQFGTAWASDGGKIDLNSVEVSYLMVDPSGLPAAPAWVGTYGQATLYDS